MFSVTLLAKTTVTVVTLANLFSALILAKQGALPGSKLLTGTWAAIAAGLL